MEEPDTITISRRTARLLGALGLVVAGAVTPALVGGNTDAPLALPAMPGLISPPKDANASDRIARLERELGIELDPVEGVAELKRDVAALKGELAKRVGEIKVLMVQVEELQKTQIDANRLGPLLESLESVAADMAKTIGQSEKERSP